MGDESAAIVEILRFIGVYDFVMDRVKDLDEVVRLFKNDFESLMALCAEGV
jgi:hypothetical protein